MERKRSFDLIFTTISPELHLIEILGRKIKYRWLDFDAYKSFENIKEKIKFVLKNFRTKHDIKF